MMLAWAVVLKIAAGLPDYTTALPPPRPILAVHLLLHTVNDPQETLEIDLPINGRVTADQDAVLRHFFRYRTNAKERSLAPRELALLADIGIRFPGHEIEIISGYRTPPNGVRHSKHFSGHAIDLRVNGVKLTDVRDVMWREHRGIGLGWYPRQGFIHIDDRDGDPEAAWTAASEGAPYQYHPRWSTRARENTAGPRLSSGYGTSSSCPSCGRSESGTYPAGR
jgi:uncharacterized protein YcbK (DUF882 family)